MKMYTVFVQASDGKGTIHIQAYRANNVERAKRLALETVAADWGGSECGFDPDDGSLHVLGVAAGDVTILEWEDLNDG